MPRLSVALAALALAAAPLGAQVIPEDPPIPADDDGPAAAYLALTTTPVGALAPAPAFMLRRPGQPSVPLTVSARVGFVERADFIDQRTWAVAVAIPAGRAAFELTAGYVDVACPDVEDDPDFPIRCRGGWTVGAQLGAPVLSRSLDPAGAQVLILGLEATAGYADLTLVEAEILGFELAGTAQSFSATAGLPLALVVRSGTVTVAPMLTPRIAFGRSSVSTGSRFGDSEGSAVRAMLGGSVAVRVADRLGFEAGLQRIFVEDAETTFGLGVTVAF